MTPNASSTGIESLSSYPKVAAIAPLDVATTGNPAFTTDRALATFHALGRTNGRGPVWRRRTHPPARPDRRRPVLRRSSSDELLVQRRTEPRGRSSLPDATPSTAPPGSTDVGTLAHRLGVATFETGLAWLVDAIATGLQAQLVAVCVEGLGWLIVVDNA
jgi:hypothetical protein